MPASMTRNENAEILCMVANARETDDSILAEIKSRLLAWYGVHLPTTGPWKSRVLRALAFLHPDFDRRDELNAMASAIRVAHEQAPARAYEMMCQHGL